MLEWPSATSNTALRRRYVFLCLAQRLGKWQSDDTTEHCRELRLPAVQLFVRIEYLGVDWLGVPQSICPTLSSCLLTSLIAYRSGANEQTGHVHSKP